MSRVLLILVLASPLVAACKGPLPTRPEDATIVYAAPMVSNQDQCSGSAVYIGDVALAPDGSMGYAVLVPYVPSNSSCGNNGGSGPQGPLSVEAFTLDGLSPGGTGGTPIGSVQTQTDDDFLPRVTATSSGPLWLAELNNSQLVLGPANQPLQFGTQIGGENPLSISVFDGNVFVAGANNGMNSSGVPDIDSPNFPCCGDGGQAETPTVVFGQLPVGLGTGTVTVPISQMFTEASALQKDRIVGDGSNFYYLASDAGGYDIMQVGLTQAPTKLATVTAAFPNPIPVGLAFGGTDVVVALAPDVYDNNQTGSGCTLWHYDLAAMAATKVFETTNFSCNDVALDGDIFFVIVDTTANCSGCNGQVRGIGVGRVGSGGGAINSLSFGLDPTDPGPRTMYIVGGMMYMVDPFVIARIDETALDGRGDIKP